VKGALGFSFLAFPVSNRQNAVNKGTTAFDAPEGLDLGGISRSPRAFCSAMDDQPRKSNENNGLIKGASREYPKLCV
jgi:hypothetical protein